MLLYIYVGVTGSDEFRGSMDVSADSWDILV